MIDRDGVPRKVVHVIAPAPFGGAETVVRQTLEGLRARNVPTTTFALGVTDPDRHPWVCGLREAHIDVRCPSPSRSREYLDLRKALSDGDVAAVHSHGYRADFSAFMARPRGVRWISTAHGFTGGGGRMRMYEAVDRWLIRSADHILAVSSRLQKRLQQSQPDGDRVRLLRNVPPVLDRPPRDVARSMLGFPTGKTIVGWVGRFSHEKGADRLPVLFSDPSTACSLVLFGDGPLRERVMHSLATLDHLQVQWMGVRSDVGRLLGAFDLLVLPSRTEGMPMVVLEAMAAGTPAIAFDVGDVKHAVTSETGWCVPTDQLPSFSAALSSALRDPEERRKRGKAASLHLQTHFSVTAWVEAHLQVYGLEEY